MKRCRLKRYNFQIITKMSKENKTSDKQEHGNDFIADVSTRTFLFSGWYAGEKFETKIKAVDKESAIADFETTWIHHRWHMVQDIS